MAIISNYSICQFICFVMKGQYSIQIVIAKGVRGFEECEGAWHGTYAKLPEADLEGAHPARTPSVFGRDRAPDFVWVSQARRMHQIMQTDFENYNISPLLRGITEEA